MEWSLACLARMEPYANFSTVVGFLANKVFSQGKTTALKILCAAHDATSGIGLVAGYDVGVSTGLKCCFSH
jgi:hypothetical protein